MHRTITVNVERHYEDGRLDRIITDYTRGDKAIRVITSTYTQASGEIMRFSFSSARALPAAHSSMRVPAKETAIRLLL